MERPAEALRRAAVELALDDRRVERPADVLGDDVVEDVDHAGLAIDPDVDEMRRGERRQDGRDRAAVAFQRLEVGREAVERVADLGQGHPALRCPLRLDRAVDQLEVADVDLEQDRGVGQDLLAQRIGRALDGAPGRIRDDAPAADRRARRGSGIGGDDRDIFGGDAQPLGGDRREAGHRPGHVDDPGHDRHPAVGLEAADGRGRLAATGPRADGDPDPLAIGQ